MRINLDKLWKNTIVMLIILNSLDALFTLVSISLFGIDVEANLFMKSMFLNYGLLLTTLFKLFSGPLSLIPPILWVKWTKNKSRKHGKYALIISEIGFLIILIFYSYILAGHIAFWLVNG